MGDFEDNPGEDFSEDETPDFSPGEGQDEYASPQDEAQSVDDFEGSPDGSDEEQDEDEEEYMDMGM